MATEVLLYLVIVLLIMQVVFIGIVINLQMKHKRMQAKYQISLYTQGYFMASAAQTARLENNEPTVFFVLTSFLC